MRELQLSIVSFRLAQSYFGSRIASTCGVSLHGNGGIASPIRGPGGSAAGCGWIGGDQGPWRPISRLWLDEYAINEDNGEWLISCYVAVNNCSQQLQLRVVINTGTPFLTATRNPTKQFRADVGKELLTARVRWKERKVRQGGMDTKKHDETSLCETGPRLFAGAYQRRSHECFDA